MLKQLLNHSAERTGRQSSLLPTFYRLRKAYSFAKKFVKRKTVLDIGCSHGYGTPLLAERAKFVTGLDKDRRAISQAKKENQTSNVTFLNEDVFRFEPNFQYEVIIAFQVLEHLKEPDLFLKKSKSWLKKRGFFLVSVVNKEVDPHGYSCPYHYREYTPIELRRLLSKYFKSINLYGVFPDLIASSYEKARKRAVAKVINKDKLGLAKILPREIRQCLLDFLTPKLRNHLMSHKPSFSQITERNFIIKKGGNGAIDLLAVCQNE